MLSKNELVNLYRDTLQDENIRNAYIFLTKSIMNIKSTIQVSNPEYSYGNIAFGYLDYTYFYITNEYLKENKLKFGIVLNHKNTNYELWLMGQNASVQSEYWELLKNSNWNNHLKSMPKYSVLETIVLKIPNFNDMDYVISQVINNSIIEMDKIISYLKEIKLPLKS